MKRFLIIWWHLKRNYQECLPLRGTLINRSITNLLIFSHGTSHCVGHTISTGLQGRCSSHTPHTPTSIRLIVSILLMMKNHQRISSTSSSIDGRYPLFETRNIPNNTNNYSYVDQSNGFIRYKPLLADRRRGRGHRFENSRDGRTH